MKRFTMILFIFWVVVALAVVPADYYIPLQVGNRLVYRSGVEGGAWAPRTVFETIEDTDSIFGKLFYKQVGSEFMDDSPTEEHIFHVFWLREDSLGNILIRAVSLTGSKELDSAMVYPLDYPMFHSEKIVPGFSMHYDYEGMHMLDSTLSNTETAATNMGSFDNCIKTMEYRTDSSGSRVWEQYTYYAENVGEVRKERIDPDPHTNVLQEVNFQINIDNSIPYECYLSQNYPNPFNPLTTIDYHLPLEAYVEIEIFNILGKKVTSLVNTERKAGYHSVIWNAMDLPSGVYIYSLEVDNSLRERRKMCILK